jgi:hypothetical protein
VNKGMKKGAGMFSFGSLLPYGSMASPGARGALPHAMSSRPVFMQALFAESLIATSALRKFAFWGFSEVAPALVTPHTYLR